MAWEVFLWIIFFIIIMALIASNLYQIVCLSDLEADYMNPYESSSRINAVVVPEMVLHGLCSALLLVTGYWFMFLLTLPITIYNSMLWRLSGGSQGHVQGKTLKKRKLKNSLGASIWTLCTNAYRYMKRQHLIDVTEVFRYVDAEKKYRIAKLALYLFLFLLVVIGSVVAGKFSNVLEPFRPTNEDLDILSPVLEF